MRCRVCGGEIPPDRAKKVGPQPRYCSDRCLESMRIIHRPPPKGRTASKEGIDMDTLELDDDALRARLRSLGLEEDIPYELACLIDIFIDESKLTAPGAPPAGTRARRKRRD